jgi:hypothetical protein
LTLRAWRFRIRGGQTIPALYESALHFQLQTF